MGRAGLAFVLLLIVAVVCVSTIPQPDLPETSYNEVDTPVNQAPPVVQGIRFVRPAIARTILPKQVCEVVDSINFQGCEKKSTSTPVQRSQRSLQDLLCTFLI